MLGNNKNNKNWKRFNRAKNVFNQRFTFQAVEFLGFSSFILLTFVIHLFSTQTFLDIFQMGKSQDIKKHHTSIYMYNTISGYHKDRISQILISCVVKIILLLTACALFWKLTLFYCLRKYFEVRCVLRYRQGI